MKKTLKIFVLVFALVVTLTVGTLATAAAEIPVDGILNGTEATSPVADANDLQVAIDAANPGDTIVLQGDVSGSGVVIDKDITIDFAGHTYTLVAPAVGSTGTKTLGFQILDGNTVTMKNGTIKVNEDNGKDTAQPNCFKMLMQNYSNLTLTDMVLDGTNLYGEGRYVLSNNCGNTVIDGATSITAKAGDYALDVCGYASYAAPSVTLNTTGTITGKIELASEDSAKIPTLEVEAIGTFNGEVAYAGGVDASALAIQPNPATDATVVLLPGQKLTYNGKTMTNDLGMGNLTFTYYAEYDQYALGVIEFTTNNATKVYDGKPLNAANLDGAIVDGTGYWDTLGVNYLAGLDAQFVFLFDYTSATITNVGEVQNGDFASIYFGDALNKKMAADYYICVNKFGKLTVTPAPFSATIENMEFVYASAELGDIFTPDETKVDGVASYLYSIDGGATWTAAVPSFKNAGEYTVMWKATLANHTDASGSYTVKINKMLITVYVGNYTAVYGEGSVNPGYTHDGVIYNNETEIQILGPDAGASKLWAVGVYENVYYANLTNSDNYDLAFVAGKFEVTPATITGISAAQFGALTYNGGAQEIVVDLQATTVNTETAAWYFGTEAGVYGEVNALPAFTNAGTYTVYYKVTAPNHLDSAEGSFQVVVNKLAVTVTVGNGEVVYGQEINFENIALDVSEILAADLAGFAFEKGSYYNTTTAVGVYTDDLIVRYTPNSNYVVTTVEGDLKVTPATITNITFAQAGNLVYNGAAQTVLVGYNATTVNNMLSTFEYSLNGEDGWTTDLNSLGFTYVAGTILANGDVVDNKFFYRVTAPNHNASEPVEYAVVISPVEGIVISLDGDNWKYYDGTPLYGSTKYQFVTGAAKLVIGDAIKFINPTSVTNVDDGKKLNAPEMQILRAGGIDVTACYAIATPNAGYIWIEKCPITVTANDWHVYFGMAPQNNGYKIEGQPEGIDLTGEVNFTYSYEQYGDIGEYAIIPSGLSTANNNYDVVYVNGKLTVDAKTINVTIDNKSETYGNPAPEFTYTTDGEENGQKIVLAWETDYIQGASVGTYYIKATNSNPNYVVNFVDGSLTIGKRTLILYIDDFSVVYGDNFTSPITATPANLYSGDTIEDLLILFDTNYAVGKPVGEYEITATIGNYNYGLFVSKGTLTVNARPVTVTVGNASVVYGEDIPNFSFDADDVYSNDDLGVNYACDYEAGKPVGDYSIGASINNPNYKLTVVDGTLTVEKRTVYVTVYNQTVAYNGVAPEYTYNIDSGLYGADDLGLTLTSEYQPGMPVDQYLIKAAITNGNYTMIANGAFLTVVPEAQVAAALEVEFKPAVYGKNNITPEVLGFKVNGEVANYQILNVYSIDGSDANDYYNNGLVMNAGEYVVVFLVTSGNYAGSRGTAVFTVEQYTVDFVNWAPVLNNKYTGSAWAPMANDLIELNGQEIEIIYKTTTGTVVGEYTGLVLGIDSVKGDLASNFKINATTMGEVKFKIDPSIEYPINAASLTIGEKYSINFKVHEEALAQYGGNYTFTVNGIELTASTPDKYGYLYFTYEGINPAHMATVFTAELIINGQKTAKTETMNYSVKEYCYNRLDALASIANGDLANLDAGNAEFAKVLVAMLRYGAEAQKYVNATEPYVSYELENNAEYALFKAIDTKTSYEAPADNAYVDGTIVTRIGNTVVMNNGVAIKLMLQATDLTGCKLYVNGVETDLAFTAENGIYSVDYAIALYDCDVAYTFEVKTADGTVIAARTYSAETYAANKGDALVQALVDFSVALKAYV